MVPGPLALILALATIAICWSLNPWFDFWRDAFSDFGVEKACCSLIYNLGLIISGAMMLLYSLGILRASATRIESFSSGLLFTASIFLMLIGVFPGGTRPHTFVSTWFFVQSFMGFASLGCGILESGDMLLGLLTCLPSAIAIPTALIVDSTVGWPSAAVAEAAGISVIAVSLISSTLHYINRGAGFPIRASLRSP